MLLHRWVESSEFLDRSRLVDLDTVDSTRLWRSVTIRSVVIGRGCVFAGLSVHHGVWVKLGWVRARPEGATISGLVELGQ